MDACNDAIVLIHGGVGGAQLFLRCVMPIFFRMQKTHRTSLVSFVRRIGMLMRLIPFGLLMLSIASIALLFILRTRLDYDGVTYLLVLMPSILFGLSAGSFFVIPKLLQDSLSFKLHCHNCGHRMIEQQNICPECGQSRLVGIIVEDNKFGSNCAMLSFVLGLCSLVPCGTPIVLGPVAIVIGALVFVSHRINNISNSRRKYAIAGIWMGLIGLLNFGLMILVALMISAANSSSNQGVPW